MAKTGPFNLHDARLAAIRTRCGGIRESASRVESRTDPARRPRDDSGQVRSHIEPRFGNGKVPTPLGSPAPFPSDTEPGRVASTDASSGTEQPLEVEDKIELGISQLSQ